MLIPRPSSGPSRRQLAPLELNASHLRLRADLVQQLLGETPNALIRYEAETKSVWIARADDLAFKTKSGVAQCIVKVKNLHGDCSIAIGEILLDEELPTQDRILRYELQSDPVRLSIPLALNSS
jgi:hypothetical protein